MSLQRLKNETKMSDRFLDKYRIPSARLQNWDYRWNGIYFITICTEGRENYFGELSNGVMELSEIGIFAQQYWYKIADHFTFAFLDSFVVMPNHIHGILILDKNEGMDDPHDFTDNQDFNSEVNQIIPGQQRFRNQGKNSVSSVMGSYKSAVTKQAHQINSCFGWQARFYDHIVQSDREFKMIQQYIDDNPANWGKDKYFEKG